MPLAPPLARTPVALALALVLAPALAAADPEPTPSDDGRGRNHFGDLALDVGGGSGLAYAHGVTGRSASGLADRVVVRTTLGMALGEGLWLEGAMRGALDPGTGSVRSTAATAGLRLDTADGALLSLTVRLGYAALLGAPPAHGAYAALGVNIRPVRAVALFAEGGCEAYPSAAFAPSTANAANGAGSGAGERLTVVAEVYYLGGIRVVL